MKDINELTNDFNETYTKALEIMLYSIFEHNKKHDFKICFNIKSQESFIASENFTFIDDAIKFICDVKFDIDCLSAKDILLLSISDNTNALYNKFAKQMFDAFSKTNAYYEAIAYIKSFAAKQNIDEKPKIKKRSSEKTNTDKKDNETELKELLNTLAITIEKLQKIFEFIFKK